MVAELTADLIRKGKNHDKTAIEKIIDIIEKEPLENGLGFKLGYLCEKWSKYLKGVTPEDLLNEARAMIYTILTGYHFDYVSEKDDGYRPNRIFGQKNWKHRASDLRQQQLQEDPEGLDPKGFYCYFYRYFKNDRIDNQIIKNNSQKRGGVPTEVEFFDKKCCQMTKKIVNIRDEEEYIDLLMERGLEEKTSCYNNDNSLFLDLELFNNSLDALSQRIFKLLVEFSQDGYRITENELYGLYCNVYGEKSITRNKLKKIRKQIESNCWNFLMSN